jgi:predicted small metal-binding protein
MTKTLSCKDLNPTTCEFSVVGSTMEEVVDQMIAHVKVNHKEDWENISLSDMQTTMSARVRDVTFKE